MKKSLLWFLLALLPLTLHSQVFIYGLVKSERSDSVIYDMIDETLMDNLFEHGFVCFNARDSNSFHLETALYAAKATGSRHIIIWRFSTDESLELMLYSIDGVEYKDSYQKINTAALLTNNTKILATRYASAIKAVLPPIVNQLQKDSTV